MNLLDYLLPQRYKGSLLCVEFENCQKIIFIKLVRSGVGKCPAHLSAVIEAVAIAGSSEDGGVSPGAVKQILIPPCNLKLLLLLNGATSEGLGRCSLRIFDLVDSREEPEPVLSLPHDVRVNKQTLVLAYNALTEECLLEMGVVVREVVFIEYY